MKKKELALFQQNLLGWFKKNKRNLPWRRNQHPYPVWVSEVMLQQTQVATVIPYFNRFMNTYPSIDQLASASIDDVLKQWEGLGYYARIRNLHESANTVVHKYNGIIPKHPEQFRALKGVGEYIAAAVLSISFNTPLAVVDGNVKRVLSRLFRIETPINHTGSLATFRTLAGTLLPADLPGDFNQAMMEIGALVCTPKKPCCDTCPLTPQCEAYKYGKTADFPKRMPRKKVPTHRIAVGVVWRDNQVLVTQRRPDGLLGGLFEFPGGKIESNESAKQACVREISEEVGLHVTIRRHLTTVHHAYTHFKIIMDVFECDGPQGDVVLNGPVAYRWMPLDALSTLAFPKANHKFIPMLIHKSQHY